MMRDYLLGALGAAFVYAIVWREVGAEARAEASRVALAARNAPGVAAPRRSPSSAAPAGQGAPERAAASPQAIAEKRAPASSPARPVAPNRVVLPLPEALPKTVDEMRELQRLAADPDALAQRVQTLESNEAELAELEAFAEKFVELPKNRVAERIRGEPEASPRARPLR